jgi:hypothetical protein
MPTRTGLDMCAAPTCHKTKLRCQCPNPWIEFLSQNARSGSRSIKEHAEAYRAAVAAGQFKPKQGMNNGTCKSDPIKLCTWMVRRKKSGKDLHSSVVDSQHRRANRILSEEINAVKRNPGLGKPPASHFLNLAVRFIRTISKDYVPKDMAACMSFLEKHLKLREHDITLEHMLGQGAHGMAISGKLRRKNVVVKIINIRHVSRFDSEVDRHNMMYHKLPHRVPKLLGHFKVTLPGTTVGVIVMEPVTAILGDILERYTEEGRNDQPFLRQVAHQIKGLVSELKAKGLSHGDLKFVNMGYKRGKSGKPEIYMIDFEQSSQGPGQRKDYDDVMHVWEESVYPPYRFMNKALHAVGFPESAVMKQVRGKGKLYFDEENRR